MEDEEFDISGVVRQRYSNARLHRRVGARAVVRSEYPTTRIVFTSGHLPDVDSIDHDGFFLKSYDACKVIDHVKTLLD